VCFKEAGCAAKALAEVQGIDGLYVRQALSKTQRQAELKKTTDRFKSSMIRFNLYFKNVPKDASEEELQIFFSQFGEIKSLKLMRKSPTEHLGFGFVSFSTIEAAARARIESKKLLFKDQQLYVCQFETKQSRLAHLEEARDKRRLENYK